MWKWTSPPRSMTTDFGTILSLAWKDSSYIRREG